MRVLVYKRQEALAAAIARGLRLQGMAVDVALDGRSGLDKACLNDYDVVILDRNLPEMHGDEVCRRLASSGSPTRSSACSKCCSPPTAVSCPARSCSRRCGRRTPTPSATWCASP